MLDTNGKDQPTLLATLSFHNFFDNNHPKKTNPKPKKLKMIVP